MIVFMKAWRVSEWCEPEQMKLEDIPIVEPGPGEVRIKNHAGGAQLLRHTDDSRQVSGEAKAAIHSGFGSRRYYRCDWSGCDEAFL